MGKTRHPTPRRYPVRRPTRKPSKAPTLFGLKPITFPKRNPRTLGALMNKKAGKKAVGTGCMLPIVALVAAFLTILLLN